MSQTSTDQPQQGQPDCWRFYPVNIITSPQLHNDLSEIIERQAENGDGVFSNVTELAEQPDVELDELLGVEIYNVVCSFQPYLDELRHYGVTGTTLGTQFTRYLFSLLNDNANFIKTNTDKPEAVKAYIFDGLKNLDGVPIWGLIFQILTLQGLCSLLDNCTLKQGDNGYNEAVSLYKWLVNILIEKLVNFTFIGGFYGDDDLKRLQPLCDYLYSTEIGRCVQETIFNGNNQEGIGNTDNADLPSVYNTDREKKYYARAIELGYMKRTATGYKWLFGGNRGLARLGYFVVKVYCPNNTEQLSESAINTLFGVNRIASAITQLHNAKKPQKWRAEIDKIFAD